jgi:hypothetical protein
MRFRAADLKPHGWAPPQTLFIPSWCGCTDGVPPGAGWRRLVGSGADLEFELDGQPAAAVRAGGAALSGDSSASRPAGHHDPAADGPHALHRHPQRRPLSRVAGRVSPAAGPARDPALRPRARPRWPHGPTVLFRTGPPQARFWLKRIDHGSPTPTRWWRSDLDRQ